MVLLNTINSKRLQTNTVHSITNVLHDKQFVRVYVVKIFICQINLKKKMKCRLLQVGREESTQAWTSSESKTGFVFQEMFAGR